MSHFCVFKFLFNWLILSFHVQKLQDLSYVDFSYACLKNVFFSRANLQSAKFRVSIIGGNCLYWLYEGQTETEHSFFATGCGCWRFHISQCHFAWVSLFNAVWSFCWILNSKIIGISGTWDDGVRFYSLDVQSYLNCHLNVVKSMSNLVCLLWWICFA